MKQIQNSRVFSKPYRDTQEATFRRLQRDRVRKSSLSRAEKEVLLTFLNHWFVHRAKGAVHPGRKKLAKRSGVSMRTVNRTLAMLRDFDVIQPVAFERGNCGEGFGMATEYTCNTEHLGLLCELPAKALKNWRKKHNAGNNGVPNGPSSGDAKMAPRNNHVLKVIYGSKGISNG